jgi:hypothetical protein
LGRLSNGYSEAFFESFESYYQVFTRCCYGDAERGNDWDIWSVDVKNDRQRLVANVAGSGLLTSSYSHHLI